MCIFSDASYYRETTLTKNGKHSAAKAIYAARSAARQKAAGARVAAVMKHSVGKMATRESCISTVLRLISRIIALARSVVFEELEAVH